MTAHRVIRYWGFFYPISIYNRIGSVLLVSGLFSALMSVSFLFWNRGLYVESIVEAGAAFGLVFLMLYMGPRIHLRASYVRSIDEIRPQHTSKN